MTQPLSPFNSQINQPLNQPEILKSDSNNALKAVLFGQTIFVVLGIIILMELFVVYKSLQKPNTATQTVAQNGQSVSQVLPMSVGKLGGAKLALIADKKDFQVGETVPVNIRVFTGGYLADGVDVILKYDPDKLFADSSSIVAGNILGSYPLKVIDQKSGVVKISAISSSSGDGFNGLGNFATINFKALTAGASDLSINFSAGSTTESNIIKQNDATDILDSVNGAKINIVAKGQTTAAGSQSCAPRTYQSCVDEKGRTGSYWCGDIADSNSCQIGCFKNEKDTDLGCNVITI